jgi:hypothetical protein
LQAELGAQLLDVIDERFVEDDLEPAGSRSLASGEDQTVTVSGESDEMKLFHQRPRRNVPDSRTTEES